uniref:Permease n=1 Tax=Steinernema glaseri TaxID=37863 RepID=A0A1I8ARA9_9BILA
MLSPATLAVISFLAVLDDILTYPIFVLSAVILFLSVKKVPSSLSRTYCVNVAVPGLLSTFVFIVMRIIEELGSESLIELA